MYLDHSVFSQNYSEYRLRHTNYELVDFYIKSDQYINSVGLIEDTIIDEILYKGETSYGNNYTANFHSTVFKRGDTWPRRVRFLEQINFISTLYVVMIDKYSSEVEMVSVGNPVIATNTFDQIAPFNSLISDTYSLRKLDSDLFAYHFNVCNAGIMLNNSQIIPLNMTPLYPNDNFWNACFYCEKIATLYAKSLKVHAGRFKHG